MPDNNNIKEVIELQLETNVEQVLKNDLTQYQKFLKETGDSARALERTITNLGKQVTSNVRSMSEGTATIINDSFIETRKLLKGVMFESIKINKEYEKTVNTIMAKSQIVANLEKKREKYFERIAKYSAEGTPKAKQKVEDIKEKWEKDKQELDKVNGKLEAFRNKLIYMTGEISSKTSEGFVKSGKDALDSIKRISSSTRNQIQNIKKDISGLDDVSKLSKLKEIGDAYKEQKQYVYNAIKEQNRNIVESDKEMQKAKVANDLQTNEKLKASNRDFWQDTLKANTDIKVTFEKMETAVNSYRQGLVKAEEQTKQLTAATQKNIKSGYGKSIGGLKGSIQGQMLNLTKNLEEKASLVRGKDISGLTKNLEKTQFSEKSIEGIINKLKQMKAEMLLLQKTGLIDFNKEVSSIDIVINKYKQFENEIKKVENQIKFLRDMQNKFSSSKDLISVQNFKNVSNEIKELNNEYKKFGLININNIKDVQSTVNKISSLKNELVTKEIEVNNKIEIHRKELDKVLEIGAKVSNKKVKAEYDKLASSIEARIKRMSGFINEAMSNVTPIDQINKMGEKVKQSGIDIQRKLEREFKRTPKEVNEQFVKLQKQYDELVLKSDKLSKKRFVSKEAINEAKKGMNDLQQKIKEYYLNIERVEKAIKELTELQRLGLGSKSINASINAMKTQAIEMKKHIQNLNKYATETQNNIDRLSKKSVLSIGKSMWESVRNFRWQVAAVWYLVTKAIFSIQRIFTNTMNEIAQYRREAMTLAAQFSYQMLGDMRKNFNNVYNYSRQLMDKMQQTAAKTILTMEDMTMLVRTFAQAGIIPDTQKDVDKIAVIGTAIKTLTEGMANAGVQMRQELYAIIAGRQRATDQLAMMFNMMGVNIQKVLKDARAEGKNMIDTLSEALEPFSVLNEKLAFEWEAIVNKMKLAWQVIKRIGLEDFLLKTVKQLDNFVSKFYDVEKGITEKGREIAVVIRSTFEILKTVVTGILSNVGTLIESLKIIGALFYGLVSPITTITNNIQNLNSTMKVTIGSLEGILKIFYTINTINRVIKLGVQEIGASLLYVAGVLELIAGILTFNKGAMKEGFDLMKESSSNMLEAVKNFYKETDEEYKNIVNSMKEIEKIIDNISNKKVNIQEQLELKYNPQQLYDSVSKLTNKIKEAELAGLSIKERANREFQMTQEEIADLKKGLTENIKSIEAYYKKMEDAGQEFTDEDIEQKNSRLKGHRDALAKLNKYEAFAARERNKILADYESKRITSYEDMILKLSNREQTYFARREQVFKQASIDIEEFVHKWGEGKKEIEDKLRIDLKIALDEGMKLQVKKDIEAIKDKFDDLENKLAGHRIKSPLVALDLEFKKVEEDITDAIKLIGYKTTDKREIQLRKELEALKGRIPVYKEEREKLILLEEQYKVFEKHLDGMAKRSEWLRNSFSPILQRKGELLSIENEYQRMATNIQKEMVETKAFIDAAVNKPVEQANLRNYLKELQDEFVETSLIMQREVWRVQHPLWNDMIEMSKSWGDQLADSLSSVIMGFEKLSDVIQNLQQTILKEALTATIKRKLIEPLEGMLGSGEPTSENKFANYLRGGNKAAETIAKMKAESKGTLDLLIAQGKPIPVYIVASGIGGEGIPGIAEGLKNAMNGTEQATKNVAETVANSSEKTNSTIKDGLNGLMNSIGNIFSSIGGGIQSGISSIGRFFGFGGESGSAVAEVTKMADGGLIKEHIIGKGLKSGKIYEFGEKEDELITPKSKIKTNPDEYRSENHHYHVSMPINVNALDTRTGVEFLMQNQQIIEAGMTKAIKYNRRLRTQLQRG